MKLFLFPYLRYKFVNAYVDKLGNMYLVSTSRSKKLGSTEIDYINVLESGYLDFELQEKLIDSFKNCNSLKPQEDITKDTVMGRFMGFKTYSRAVKGLKLIEISWYYNQGYVITPTEKKKGHGYIHLDKQKINSNEDALAAAVRRGIDASRITSE
ncbi:hypothetical protein MKX42_23820 [Paenibacillus sp. FSL R7-0204]|uniref:hypothetical protein n=1 Tax=Paenibacillus sp. FSL R7-0204 TaxID=2921675 RepID=UPI0030F6E435